MARDVLFGITTGGRSRGGRFNEHIEADGPTVFASRSGNHSRGPGSFCDLSATRGEIRSETEGGKLASPPRQSRQRGRSARAQVNFLTLRRSHQLDNTSWTARYAASMALCE